MDAPAWPCDEPSRRNTSLWIDTRDSDVLIRVPPPSGVGARGYPDPLTPATFPLILPDAATACSRSQVTPEGLMQPPFGATHRHAILGPPSMKGSIVTRHRS